MKKRLLSLILILCLTMVFSITAFADSYNGTDGWTVTFTANEKMESNFQSSAIADAIKGMQPGDDLTLTITLANDYKDAVDWYMMNDVLKSLEDETEASGGAYTYILSYQGSQGTALELFNSDSVGGEQKAGSTSPEGLHAATSSLADYLYLDAIASGGKGTVTLKVALDGESQGNRYQGTLGSLRLRFAVETAKGTIKTGDETNELPFYIAFAAGGAAIMLLVIIGLIRRKRKEVQS